MVQDYTSLSEHSHTVIVADYCRARGFLFSKIPSETFTKSWGTKARNKSEGVNKGVPDFVVLHPKRLLWIELKKARGAKGGLNGSQLGDEQILWVDALNSYDGVSAKFCHGADEAIEYIKSFD